jgi:hypothetical protein
MLTGVLHVAAMPANPPSFPVDIDSTHKLAATTAWQLLSNISSKHACQTHDLSPSSRGTHHPWLLMLPRSADVSASCAAIPKRMSCGMLTSCSHNCIHKVTGSRCPAAVTAPCRQNICNQPPNMQLPFAPGRAVDAPSTPGAPTCETCETKKGAEINQQLLKQR